MDVTKISDGGLKSLHKSVAQAAAADAKNLDKHHPYYGVNDFPDWAIWRDMLEGELQRRGIKYTPVHF